MRVAVVGLGWAGRSIWLPRLREHPAFTTVVGIDPNATARDAAAGIDTAVPMHSTMDGLAPGVVDLAVVAVPNHLHSRVACHLLGRGVPVFLEKPVCISSAEADQIATAERVGGATLLAGSAASYRADVRALRDLVRDLGPVRHVELAWVRARGVPEGAGWFTQRQLAGGGALVDLGWHLLDLIRLLLPGARFEQVVGAISDDFINDGSRRAAWRRDAGAADEWRAHRDVEDTARGFLVTSDGISVSLRVSWASHEPQDVTLIRVDGAAGTADLQCTFGFSPNRLRESTLTCTKDGVAAVVPVPAEPIGAEYRRQLDKLPGLLATPGIQGRAVEDARRTVDLIERIYASACAGRATPANRPVVHADR